MIKFNRRLLILFFIAPLASLAPLASHTAFGQIATTTITPRASNTEQSSSTALSISGEVARPLQITSTDLAKLPRRTVRAKDHEVEATFEGVPLVDVLKLAGVEFGETLRGKRLGTYLLVKARDGYQAVFALPELDPAFTDRLILIADRRDGKPLNNQEGPLRIVIPDERRHARWVRQVAELVIRRS